MEFLLNNGNFKMLYNTIYSKKKERFELILEPLQAILQLALLSFCPKGTKITIHQNILQLQMPYYTQGILRWYQNDNKDDLFYLFYVCKRFTLFYQHLKDIKCGDYNLYDMLIICSSNGLNNLIETYSNSEKISLLHTLELYKLLLNNPQQFDMINGNQKLSIDLISETERTDRTEGTSNNSDNINKDKREKREKKERPDKEYNRDNRDNKNNSDKIDKNITMYRRQTDILQDNFHSHKETNIDTIFIKIVKLYSHHEYNIILNILLLLINNSDIEGTSREKIIYGLNEILYLTTNKINKWIHKNIVF